MTEWRLSSCCRRSGESDFLRAVAEAVLQILMEADVEGLIGAGRHERSAPGPGRSPKADPRLASSSTTVRSRLAWPGTIGVISMAAHSGWRLKRPARLAVAARYGFTDIFCGGPGWRAVSWPFSSPSALARDAGPFLRLQPAPKRRRSC